MTTRAWNRSFCGLAAAGILAMAAPAQAKSIALDVTGPGVSASLVLTYGLATDIKYPDAFEITSIAGTFSDSNNGLNIVNASVGWLIPITHDAPEPGNLLAPRDFSRFSVASGLPPESNGFITFDNLFWPAGAPQTATHYPFGGGVLDIYGLMFTLSGGQVVDLWSNGIVNGPAADYGVAVATSDAALDYVSGVSVSTPAPAPEPATLMIFGAGLFGFATLRFRQNHGRSLRG